MYRPDPSIVKQLKESDPDLDARWDSTKGRWWVTCMGKDAVLVANEDGSYRPLDGRIVQKMREEAWLYRHKFGALHLHDREVHMSNYQRIQQAKAARRDEIRQYHIEETYPRVVGVGGATGRNKFAGWSAGA